MGLDFGDSCNSVKALTKSLNKSRAATLNSLFEKGTDSNYTKDAILCQDILRYYLNANSENNPFSLRKLQHWIIKNNRDIVEEYQGSKGHTPIKNRIHAKETRINNKFEILLEIGLVKRAEKIDYNIQGMQRSLYKSTTIYLYTKAGILLALIIRSINFEKLIKIEKDQKQVVSLTKELEENNYRIYQLIDSTLPTGDDCPYSNIFYKLLYKKINDKGFFNELVSHIIFLCDHSGRLIRKVHNLLEYGLEFGFLNKEIRKRFSQLENEVLEDLQPEVKDVILHEIKLSVEGRFQQSKGHLSREYEKQRFRLRSEHTKIVLEGCCEKCKQQTIVSWSYIDYREKWVDADEYNNIHFDCPKCNTKDGCIIPVF